MSYPPSFPGNILTNALLAQMQADITLLQSSGGSSSIPTGSNAARTLADFMGDLPSITGFAGIDMTGATDCSVALKLAHDACASLGKRHLYFPPGTLLAASAVNLSQVIFIGEGRLVGTYRKQVASRDYARHMPQSAIRPARHLPRLQTITNPNVVVAGDSTTAGTIGTAGDTLVATIQAALARQNPAGVPTMFDEGIGGSTFFQIDTDAGNKTSPGGPYEFIPAASGNWYLPNQTTPWLTITQAAAPDLLVLNMGMNDGAGFDFNRVLSIVAKTKTWTPVPDLCFITNSQPSNSLAPTDTANYNTYSTKAGQEGHEFVAGYIRSYCLMHGYGLIDQNRTYIAARDGYDVVDHQLSRALPALGSPNISPYPLPFTLPSTYNFEFKWGWNTNGSTMFAAGAAQLAITLSSAPLNRLLLGLDAASGHLTVAVQTGTRKDLSVVYDGLTPPGSKWTSTDSGVPVYSVPPTTTSFTPGSNGTNIIIALIGSFLQIISSNVGNTIWAGHVEKFGGAFTPTVSWLATAGNSGAGTLFYEYVSTPTPCMPYLTDLDIQGPSAGAIGGIVSANGGNGINHPNSKGLHEILRPTIEATNFYS